jgi:hypothetical protein
MTPRQRQDRNAQRKTEKSKRLDVSSLEPSQRTVRDLVTTLDAGRRSAALARLGTFNDPGTGAAPPVIFVTSRAVHSHLNFWKCIKYHGPGVEPSGNRSSSSRTANEDVAFRALLGCRQDCVKRVRHVHQCGYGCSGAARGVDLRVWGFGAAMRLGSAVRGPCGRRVRVQRRASPASTQTSRPMLARSALSRAA